jgi:hypothetical protein
MLGGSHQTFACSIVGGTVQLNLPSACALSVQEGAAGGSVAGGVYTAPSASGVYHLVASSVANPGVTATATITVVSQMGKPDWTRIETMPAWDYPANSAGRSSCGTNEGTVYNVGPSRGLKRLRDVDWVNLMPCDQVLVDYSSTPYTDRVFIASRGEFGKSIVLRGLRGPNGERPIISGQDAVTPTDGRVSPFNGDVGMITVANYNTGFIPNMPYGYRPGHLVISGFEFEHVIGPARTPTPIKTYSYTDAKGNYVPWSGFVADIYVLGADDLEISDNYFHDSSTGIFVNSLFDAVKQSSRLFVLNNTFRNLANGDPGVHPMYTEAAGEVVRGNLFYQPQPFSTGVLVKDRSVCTVFDDNYLESGNLALDFRDPQSNAPYESTLLDAFGERCASNLFVTNNVLVAKPGLWGASFLEQGDGHTAGAVNNPQAYRRDGDFYAVNNVFISAWTDYNPYSGRSVPIWTDYNNAYVTTAFHAINNLFYVAAKTSGAKPAPLTACYWGGKMDYAGANWTNLAFDGAPYAKAVDGNGAVGAPCDGSGMAGLVVSTSDPGFVDFANGNYHLLASSPYFQLNAPLPAALAKRGLGVRKPLMVP